MKIDHSISIYLYYHKRSSPIIVPGERRTDVAGGEGGVDGGIRCGWGIGDNHGRNIGSGYGKCWWNRMEGVVLFIEITGYIVIFLFFYFLYCFQCSIPSGRVVGRILFFFLDFFVLTCRLWRLDKICLYTSK